ncbi:MAG: cytochrome c [Elusimicrobia bacterium]|nr:cytochrome c [Elusimicrobiota bacterium]
MNAERRRAARASLWSRLNEFRPYVILLALLLPLACRKQTEQSPRPRAGRFTPQQLQAKFVWDLGAGAVDVAGYPDAQRKNYEVFKAKCSLCHTLARPINAPFVGREDWKRYVHRMHAKGEAANMALSEKEEKAIVNFLVYDAQERKVKRAAQFEEDTTLLEELFDEVQKEQGRLALEEGKKEIRSFTYTGDRP